MCLETCKGLALQSVWCLCFPKVKWKMIFKLSLTFKVCILNEGIHEEIEGEVIWEYSILDLHTEIRASWKNINFFLHYLMMKVYITCSNKTASQCISDNESSCIRVVCRQSKQLQPWSLLPHCKRVTGYLTSVSGVIQGCSDTITHSGTEKKRWAENVNHLTV